MAAFPDALPAQGEHDRAVAELAAALGDGAVLTDDATLRDYADPYTYDGRDEFLPAAVALPTTVEEVQAVLRVARERRVPVWTVSQGRNNGYGGPAPRVGGSIVVSLRNMDKVLHIDGELAYALVEPGVRFFDLHDAIAAGGHDLMMSVPDLGWGSIVGNALDHGVGYTPYGDHAASHCGMEVVLADGDVLRTGMGAMNGNRAWQCYPRGFGPTADGIFMQSNFGIVTKMGVSLMPTPDCYLSCGVQVPEQDDLYALIDVLRTLMLDRTIQNVPVIANALTAAAAFTPRAQWWDGDGPVPEEVIDGLCRQMGLGRWQMRFALYGSEEVVEAQFRACERTLKTIPGANVVSTKYAGDADPGDIPWLDQVQAGVPNLDLLQAVKWRSENGGHLGVSPVSPLTGRDARRMNDLLLPIVARHGFDYMGGLLVMPRCVIQVYEFIYDRDDRDEVDRAFAACRELIVEAARAGYGEYRAHLEVMDLVAEQYDFNDHAQRRFNERLKDALDPDGILAPGKQGIWPAGMRPAGA
jgi:4-cresol dehydrogenase (hydroxylating) flavoprotein subunit